MIKLIFPGITSEDPSPFDHPLREMAPLSNQLPTPGALLIIISIFEEKKFVKDRSVDDVASPSSNQLVSKNGIKFII